MAMIRAATTTFLLLTALTGVAYPLLVTAVAQGVFPLQANGSLRTHEGRVVGSALIGQDFSSGEPARAARWFWGRPSATAPSPYTALDVAAGGASGGSNLAPSNPLLRERAKERIAALAAAARAVGLAPSDAPVPVELVTSSASGLDPHLSVAAAEFQVARVARARGLSEDTVRALVRAHTSPRTLGILGEPTVHVLELNLALEALGRSPEVP